MEKTVASLFSILDKDKNGSVSKEEFLAGAVSGLMAEQLAANAGTLMAALLRMKPSTAKGTYVRSVAVSSTMGLGIRVDTLDAQRFAESL